MSKCRLCQSSQLNSIIPLGKMPLANALTNYPQLNSKLYNLEVLLCNDCGLAQLKDIVNPKELFSEYIYFSSNSDTMLRSAKKLVNKLVKNLTQNSQVIEIASNDGYLLNGKITWG